MNEWPMWLDRAQWPHQARRWERVLFAFVRALRGSSAFHADLWARRAALSPVPLAIVWGMRDSAFRPSNLERWVTAFPHATVTRIDDAGHWPHEETPHAVIPALRARLPDGALTR